MFRFCDLAGKSKSILPSLTTRAAENALPAFDVNPFIILVRLLAHNIVAIVSVIHFPHIVPAIKKLHPYLYPVQAQPFELLTISFPQIGHFKRSGNSKPIVLSS